MFQGVNVFLELNNCLLSQNERPDVLTPVVSRILTSMKNNEITESKVSADYVIANENSSFKEKHPLFDLNSPLSIHIHLLKL